MKVAIIDDEVHCVEGLVLHLRKNFPDAEIIYKGTRPESALEEKQSFFWKNKRLAYLYAAGRYFKK